MEKHYMQTRLQNIETSLTDKYGIIEGHAAVYNEIIPSYNELVLPGAFNRTHKATKGGKVPIFYMHSMMYQPSEWIGLGLDADPNDSKGYKVQGGLNIHTSESAKSIHGLAVMCAEAKRPIGLSIGFSPVKQTVFDDDRPTEIKEVRLYEYSVCPPDFQAAPNATAPEVRSQYQEAMFESIANALIELGVKTPALDRFQAERSHATDTTDSEQSPTLSRLDPTLVQSISDKAERIVKSLTRS